MSDASAVLLGGAGIALFAAGITCMLGGGIGALLGTFGAIWIVTIFVNSFPSKRPRR